jgi:hypothetical protein
MENKNLNQILKEELLNQQKITTRISYYLIGLFALFPS